MIIGKTIKLYKNKTLMSFLMVTLMIGAVVVVPVAVSDPPKTEDTTGPVTPNKKIPTTPGFRYNPEDDMTITGYAEDMSLCAWSPGCDECDDWWDYYYFDDSLDLSEYGPNILQGSSDLLSTLCVQSGPYDSHCYAHGNLQIGYAATGLIRKIILETDSNATSNVSVTNKEWGHPVSAGNFGRLGTSNDDKLLVSLPFSVSETGWLYVEKSCMLLESSAEGRGDTWGYSIEGKGMWSIVIFDQVYASDEFEVEVYDEPGHQERVDQWDGDRYIRLPAGDYKFTAEFHMYHFASCAATPPPEPDHSFCNVSSHIRLSIELLYIGCCIGDIDGDGDTDQSDLGILLAAWDSRPGDDNWDPRADIDEDGHVSQSDLGTLLSNWGCGT